MTKPRKNPINFFDRNNRWLPVWVALAGFLLYVNTLNNDYAIDDGAVIGANPYVQQGLKGLPGIFTTDMWHFENADLGYYRPLPLATFAIEHQFFNNNPTVSHLVNALLYGLTGFLLFLLLLRIFSSYNALFAWVVALLFMAHPIHTEVVANIKSRDEILSFLNLLLSILLLLRGVGQQKAVWRWLLPSCLFFYLALLSKESAIAGLLIIPVLLYSASSSRPGQIAKWLSPFIILVLVFQFQKYLLLGTVTGAANPDIVSFPYAEAGSKWATAFLHLAWYVKLILVPYPLSYSYAYNQLPAADWSSIGAICGIIIAVLLAFFSLRGLQKRSPLSLGIFLFAVLILPAMAFTVMKGGVLAERFLYASTLGFCIVITWSLFKLLKLPLETGVENLAMHRSKLAVFVAIFICYSFTTISRNMDWKNDMTLSAHDVINAPNNCQIHLHYGKKLIDEGVTESNATKKQTCFNLGTEQLRSAFNIEPHYARAYFKMAYAYQALQVNDDSAIYYYTRAIDEAPGYSQAYGNLGALYAKLGRIQLANHYLKKALEINPNMVSAAQLLQKLQQPLAPASNQTLSGSADSTNAFESYSNLGVKCARDKNFTDAQKYLLKAIQLKPTSAEARVNLAVCYGMMNEYGKSEQVLLDALKIDPANKAALRNLVALYHLQGNKLKEQEYQDKLNKAASSGK